MKNIVAIIISIFACILLGILFLSQKTSMFKGFKSNTKNDSAYVTGSISGNEPRTTETTPKTPSIDSDIHTTSDTEETSESEIPMSVTKPSSITFSNDSNSQETSPPATAGESETTPSTTVSDQEDEVPKAQVSETTEKAEEPEESQETEIPDIVKTAEQNGFRYDLREFVVLSTLPQGVSLSDTTQSFGSFDTYDENGFATSRGDSVASHLSENGKYDGYLGKEYVWAVLRFDLTNLSGKGGYINVGDLKLSFGEYKKVRYMGKDRYRYSNSVTVGYMNMHDAMPEIPADKQYYTLYFTANETKQLVFCYLMEKKYSDETFYLEMNIHNDGESYDWLKLN